MNKKVSLISPCYNGSKYLKWFLDSLVEQTYQNVEFIFVNDGSTDNTEEIFMSYKPKLEEKGWEVIYIKQKNGGVCSAINQGLKIFTGDYLICPDSDDILYPNHIEEKVNFMEQNPNCGLAFNIVDIVNESNINHIIGKKDNSTCTFENFADNLLQFKLNIWTPVSYIIRSSSFIHSNPQREIYLCRLGQNFQLLYPVAKCYPVKFIDKSLAKYVVRMTSISHKKVTDEQEKQKNYEFYNLVLTTILRSNISEEDKKIDIAKTSMSFGSKLLKNGVIEVASYTKKIKLFNLIPFIKVKKKNNKTTVYFLGILILTIKEK